MTWEVLCKCSGKYIDIYFNLKITYVYLKELLSSLIGGASTSYFKNFCPRPRVLWFLSSPIGELLDLTLKIFVLVRVRAIWFYRTITLESLNQSEPNFRT